MGDAAIVEDVAGEQWSDRLKHVVLLILVTIVSLSTYKTGKEYVSVSPPESSIQVDHGYLALSSGDSRPSRSTYGKPIALDNSVFWPSSSTGEIPGDDYVWVTSLIELTAVQDSIWALHIPHTKFQFKFFVNGLELADIANATSAKKGGRFSSLVSIPKGVLRSGENEFQIRLSKLDDSTFLIVPSFIMGPLSDIAPYYSSQTLFSESFPKAVITLLLILGIALLTIWLTFRSDRVYMALGICGICWAGYLVTRLPNINMMFEYQSLSMLNSLLLFVFSLSLLGLCFVFTAVKAKSYMVTSVLLGSFLLFNTFVFTESPAQQLDSYLALMMLFLIICGITLIVIQKKRLPSSAYVVLSILMLLCFQIVDQFVIKTLSVNSGYSPLQFIAPLFIFVVVAKMFKDFIKSKKNLELINRDLEQIVEHRTEKMEVEMMARKKVEEEKIIADERNRLMMEMHDGLGARLVGLISQMDDKHTHQRNENVRVELKETLNELRLVVDSMSPFDGDLVSVLAMFRQRLQKALRGTDKELIWQVDDLPFLEDLSPEKTLNILRILQEATTNAIKYSSGRTISVLARSSDSGNIAICIFDDGFGLLEDASGTGHGIANMKKRALMIGADIEFKSNRNGLSVVLTFVRNRSNSSKNVISSGESEPDSLCTGFSKNGARNGSSALLQRLTSRLPHLVYTPSSYVSSP